MMFPTFGQVDVYVTLRDVKTGEIQNQRAYMAGSGQQTE